jgi:hypothetical protein
LQRTPNELLVSASDPDRGRWVGAVTVGYSHALAAWEGFELALGGSVTKTFLPNEMSGPYGGNPWTARVFAQIVGMRMWML